MHYDDPEYQKLLTDSKSLLDENQRKKHRQVAEVALILSPPSVCELTLTQSKAAAALYSGYFRVMSMAGLGAPFDEYLLEDFEVIDKSYKLYIFAGCFRVDRDTRKRIHEKLAAENATALWIGPGGLIDGAGNVSAEAAAETMGIRIKRESSDGWIQVDLTDDQHELTQGLSPGERSFGNRVDVAEYDQRGGFLGCAQDYRFGPAFSIDDPDADIFGILRDAMSPGLAVKSRNDWTSIYSAAPMPPASLLRNALASAGGHIYSPHGDLIYANTGFLGLVARSSGARRVNLPKPMDVIDANTGESVGESCQTFTVKMHAHGVRLFKLSAV
jgi:hypothetical protein